MVLPAPPIRRDEDAMEVRPVPPRVAEREPVVSESAMPREEVAIWIMVLPVEPMRMDDEAIDESPVPPRVAANVPSHCEVKVWVEPLEVMVRPMFVSDEVAKVWVAEVRPFSDVMPVVSVIQVPFTAKQPAAKLMPLAKVEEAEPVTLSASA